MEYKGRKYGWAPDLPDKRDFKFVPDFFWWLPKSVDLAASFNDVLDQGNTGTCVAHAITDCVRYIDKFRNRDDRQLSRLFLYYNARALEGCTDVDEGVMIRSAMSSVVKDGICDEKLWQFDPRIIAVKPDSRCYTDGKRQQVLVYRRLKNDVRAMKSCLASKRPFVFGITIYESFTSDQVRDSGIVPEPAEEFRVGGHAMVCCGYDNAISSFKVRNSWGSSWGKGGYCWIPYSYMCDPDLCDDLWVIENVE